jgi:hypothetical protein
MVASVEESAAFIVKYVSVISQVVTNHNKVFLSLWNFLISSGLKNFLLMKVE